MLLRKKGEVILACCLLAFILAGCGSSEQQSPEVKAKPASALEAKQPTTTTAAVKPYVFGKTLTFSDVQVEPYLVRGWSGKEDWGRWTDGPVAEIRFPLHQLPEAGDYSLMMRCQVFPPGKQKVIVSLNGTQIGEIGPNLVGQYMRLSFDGKLLRNENVVVFQIENPMSPGELGQSADLRKLGLGVVNLQLNRADATFAPSPYVLGQTLNFNDVQVEPYLGKGWSHGETWGRWTDGPIAELRLPLEKFSTDGNFTLTLQCGLLQPDKQQIGVSLNGTRIGEIGPGLKGPQVEIPFQGKLLRQQNLIVFDIEDPISPKELGTSPDARKLGLSAVSAKIGKD